MEDLPLHSLDGDGRRAVCSAVVRAARDRVRESLNAGEPTQRIVAQLADDHDALLRSLCADTLPPRGRVAVLALGGYGRRELFPYSDLDLLFLHEGVSDGAMEALLERIVYPLWDAKVSVGHAARTVEQSLELGHSDLTLRTALLDARLLFGDAELFATLRAGAQQAFFAADRVNHFVAALVEERTARHARFGESIYLLEPNIKSNKGGLRDLNAALWAAEARYGVDALEQLAEVGAATPRQTAAMVAARDFLGGLRLAMHVHAGRAQDQLLFELQERLAPELFPESEIPGERARSNAAVAPAVERLMHAFYRHAQTVVIESEGILERCELADEAPRPPPDPVADGFAATGSWLVVPSPEIFWDQPAQLLRAFALARQRELRLDRAARDAMAEAVAGDPGRKLSVDEEAAELFLELLCRHDAPTLLREMHDLGLLAAMIPELGPCTGRVQHDLYHVYTVDQHTLYVVALLHGLRRGESCTACRRAPEVMRELAEPRDLYLAALLHDVAKPLGPGHARRGARLEAAAVARLGRLAATKELVSFLVREHLAMSHASQRRDLGDPAVIAAFAELVGTEERLRALYLLSVADAAMTAPDNLTEWKASLLDDLYSRTLRFLHGEYGAEDLRRRLAERRAALAEALWRTHGELGRDLVARLPERLLQGTRSLEDLERQLGLLVDLQRDAGGVLRSASRILESRGVSELTVCCRDAPGVLAMIAGVMSLQRIEVLSAQIYTLPGSGAGEGLVLDVFRVQLPEGTGGSPWERLHRELERALRGELRVADAVRARHRRPSRSSRVLPAVRTTVRFDNEASEEWTVIEVQSPDRPGLLHAVTQALSDLQLEIQWAMISSELGRVIDAFYVQDGRTGGKIAEAAAQRVISRRLTEVVDELSGDDPDAQPGGEHA